MKIFSFPLIKYFAQVREELDKVTWPSRKDVQNKTLIVIGVSLLVGLYISGLDLIFTRLTQLFLN